MSGESRPIVGIGILIFNDKGQVLIHKRKSSHGEGEYAGLGGHLEYGESFEDCAKREVMEEAGIEIEDIRFLCLAHVIYPPKHFIDIGLTAKIKSGQIPKIMEPDKSSEQGWFDIDDIPTPLFANMPNYIQAFKTGKKFFDGI
jgi:8-oxo-dGTP diphosphatase